MVVTVLCQVINLVRDILLVKSFGATSINDVYLVSQTVVSIIITMINSPMAAAFIPVTTKYYINKTDEEKNKFVSMIYSDVFIVAICLCFIELTALDGIVEIAAPGFEESSKIMLKKLIIIQVPITFVNIIKGVNRGNFQILQRFKISEFTNIFPYICMCFYLILPLKKDVYVIAIILSGATCISIIPEIITLYKKGFRYRFSLGINEDIKTMVMLMIAASVTAGIREINVLFDKTIGSLLPMGNITMISYASKLTVVVVGLITASISLISFTNIAKHKSNGKIDDVLNSIVDSCTLINFIVIPASFYLIFYSYDIIKILYYGGDFNLISVSKTANLMKLYAIGLIGYGFQDVYTRTLHTYKIVRCTIKESALMVSVNIFLNIALYRFMGAYGVALATSISILVVIPILGKDVEKNVGKYDRKLILMEMLKNCVASMLTIIVAVLFKYIVKGDGLVFLLVESLTCGVIYLFLSLITRSRVLIKFMDEIKCY